MRMWGKRNPGTLLMRMEISAATIGNRMEAAHKYKRRNQSQKAIEVLHNSQDRKPAQVPSVDEQIKITWYVYTMEY